MTDKPDSEQKIPRMEVSYGKKLGSGANGTVWEATDVLLERQLAVKFLTSTEQSLDEKALLREARSLARISHPNLVTVFGAAWLRHPETGLVAPAIMMELIVGEQILTWRTRPQDRKIVLRVARDVLAAMTAIHEAGLHHGDLHARNVMVMFDGRAKIIDWRYQDSFLAKSTVSREELVDQDRRICIDILAALLEKQEFRTESTALLRTTDLVSATEFIKGLLEPNTRELPQRASLPDDGEFDPHERRIRDALAALDNLALQGVSVISPLLVSRPETELEHSTRMRRDYNITSWQGTNPPVPRESVEKPFDPGVVRMSWENGRQVTLRFQQGDVAVPLTLIRDVWRQGPGTIGLVLDCEIVVPQERGLSIRLRRK